MDITTQHTWMLIHPPSGQPRTPDSCAANRHLGGMPHLHIAPSRWDTSRSRTMTMNFASSVAIRKLIGGAEVWAISHDRSPGLPLLCPSDQSRRINPLIRRNYSVGDPSFQCLPSRELFYEGAQHWQRSRNSGVTQGDGDDSIKVLFNLTHCSGSVDARRGE
jgi:hypothetical protein